MASLGQKLKDERIRQGRPLRAIADELRIGSRYLEAIEAEDWKQLPGGFFNRSFIRQYAAALGFDAAQIEQEFSALMRAESPVDLSHLAAANDPRAQLDKEKRLISVDPLPAPSGGFFDSRTSLTIAALVVLIAGGGALSLMWDRFNASQQIRKQETVAAPAPVVPPPAASIQQPEAQPQTPQAGQQPAVTEVPADQTAAIVPTVTSTPTADGSMTLNIEATEKTWIEVTADGKRIFVGILNPGESKNISTQQRAKMVVGNAGGIAVRKGGRDIGPIGPRGQVRTVNITQEAVEIVPPATGPTGE